jgi:hypothetical protein
MPNLKRTPWIAIDVDIRKDDRLVDLPSDSARYGYIAGVLAESRLQDPRAVFPSRAVLAESIGRFDRFVPKYLEVGLLHQVPHRCEPCNREYGDLRRGAIVVHNWHGKQRDPAHAERQAKYIAGRQVRDESDAEDDAEDDGKVTATSRARAVTLTQTPNTDTREEIGSPVVRPRTRPNGASPSTSSSGKDERPDVAALKAAGWRRVTAAQLSILDEVADYERRTEYDVESGQQVVATWIRRAPAATPVGELLTHVLDTSRRLRDERQARADGRTELGDQHKRGRLHPSIASMGGADA